MASRPRKKLLKAFPRTVVAILVGAIAVALITVFSIGSTNSSSNVQASTKVGNQKRFKATRPIAVDKQTGRQRMPTQQEVDETVASLKVLTNRPEDLPQTSAGGSAVAIDLEGGFGGTILARPNGDGTWETRCVFTFEEAADFLGLVPDNSSDKGVDAQ